MEKIINAIFFFIKFFLFWDRTTNCFQGLMYLRGHPREYWLGSMLLTFDNQITANSSRVILTVPPLALTENNMLTTGIEHTIQAK